MTIALGGAGRRTMRPAVAAGITWCAVGRIASAQLAGVAVDPHMVVLTSAHPTGEITVFNPRGTRAEYEIALRYGLAGTDSAGRSSVRLTDAPAVTAGAGASAAALVRPYPARFVLSPGAWQTVRLGASVPEGLPDGEYWARVVILSRDLAPPAPLAVAGGVVSGVSASLAVESATVLPLFLRAGAVRTGIVVDSFSVRLAEGGDSIDIATRLRRSGNAAYIGSVAVVAFDSGGRVVARATRPIAVYGESAPRWSVRLDGGMRGRVPARVEVLFRTHRDDVAARWVLPADDIRVVWEGGVSAEFRLPRR